MSVSPSQPPAQEPSKDAGEQLNPNPAALQSASIGAEADRTAGLAGDQALQQFRSALQVLKKTPGLRAEKQKAVIQALVAVASVIDFEASYFAAEAQVSRFETGVANVIAKRALDRHQKLSVQEEVQVILDVYNGQRRELEGVFPARSALALVCAIVAQGQGFRVKAVTLQPMREEPQDPIQLGFRKGKEVWMVRFEGSTASLGPDILLLPGLVPWGPREMLQRVIHEYLREITQSDRQVALLRLEQELPQFWRKKLMRKLVASLLESGRPDAAMDLVAKHWEKTHKAQRASDGKSEQSEGL